jgi:acetyl esterase/lipase
MKSGAALSLCPGVESFQMELDMKRYLAPMIAAGLSVAAQNSHAADRIELPLWEHGAPGNEGKTMHETVVDTPVAGLVSGVWNPVLYVYLPPKELATGTAVVIFPGGGYNLLAMDHEGVQVAKFLNSFGVAGIICKYRVRDNANADMVKVRERALLDAKRAMRQVRSHASEWNINPDRLGVLGFSAGGHLVVNLATTFDAGDPNSSDSVERQSCKPVFVAPIYPGLQGVIDRINDQTPPMFIVHATDDDAVPVMGSVKLFQLLRERGIPAELHIFTNGGHGFGMGKPDTAASAWPGMLKDWITRKTFLQPTTKPAMAPPPK